MLMAIFGGHPSPARAHAAAQESVAVSAPPEAREPEPVLETVDLTPVAAPEPPPQASSAPARQPAAPAPAKHRAMPAAAPAGPAASSAPVATTEPDLFDGRK